MGLSICGTLTDLHDKELSEHGDSLFPIACYDDNLSIKDVPWHWHEEWEFVLVTEGTLCFHMENTRIQIEKGNGVFINSKALHSIKNPGKLHSAVFHPRLIGGNVDSVFWQELVQPFFTNSSTRFLILNQDIPWQKEVLLYFHNAWKAIAYEQEDYQNEARYQLSKAVRIILHNTDFSQSNLSDQEFIRIQRIRKMMEYIDLHYMEDLSVESIANSIAVSTSVCMRCFHDMLQTTPMQYVIDTRLRKAASLLQSTNKSAKEIAMDCGFNDISYFTKIFRKKFQCTPGNYRKMS